MRTSLQTFVGDTYLLIILAMYLATKYFGVTKGRVIGRGWQWVISCPSFPFHVPIHKREPFSLIIVHFILEMGPLEMSKKSHGTEIFGSQNISKYEKVFLFYANFHISLQKNNHLKFRQIKNVTE